MKGALIMSTQAKKSPTLDDYQKLVTSENPMKAGFEAQKNSIDLQASEQQQQAYILNEKMKKYLTAVNSSYGQEGLGGSGEIAVANNYANNLGDIAKNKTLQTNDMFSSYAGMIQNQKNVSDERKYNEGLLANDRAYQTQLIEQEYKKAQESKSSEIKRQSQMEIRGIIEGMIPLDIQNLMEQTKTTKLNRAQVNQIYGQYLAQYGQMLSEEDRNYLKVVLEAYTK